MRVTRTLASRFAAALVIPVAMASSVLVAPSAQAETIYTLAQVSTHYTATDCWSAISGGVYNLTNFISRHEGGRTPIIGLCGIDGTASYLGQHRGESEPTQILAGYRIGALDPTPPPTPTTPYTMAQVATHNTAANCWTVINAKVYNLSTFGPRHVGGATVITALCGMDGTASYVGKHGTAASPASALSTLQIGVLSGTSTPPPPTATYTMAQVATHNTAANCWTAINSKVYDLSTFGTRHVGGAAVITALCGMDGTASYVGKHGTGASAASALAQLQIGTLTGGTTPTPNGSYTMAQVATHNTAADCWTVISGGVYNLTSFANNHAGGSGVITALCGIDGTNSYNGKHGGSATTPAVLAQLKIGTATDWVPVSTPTITALGGNGQYTMDEVAAHNNAGSCWSVVNGSVYDLTGWIGVHPGGGSTIIAMCGVDGTAAYNGKHGGSGSAGAKLSLFRIGSVVATKAVTDGVYTMDQVSAHKTAADCWSVVDGVVYDLTKWVPQHPGGSATIIAMCGVDGSAAFNGKHGTSAGAKSSLALFKIGTLSGAATVVPPTGTAAPTLATFTFKQVRQHRTAKNCWSVVNGNVYNLTPWTKKHTGAKKFIKTMCGRNGTKAYNAKHGGPVKASRILKRYQIGKLGAAPVAPAAPAATYTLAQVAAHNTVTDCWSAVSGSVYNLTTWIPRHPGGAGVIKAMCGVDGTASYTSMHKGSASAAAVLVPLKVGTLG